MVDGKEEEESLGRSDREVGLVEPSWVVGFLATALRSATRRVCLRQDPLLLPRTVLRFTSERRRAEDLLEGRLP